MWWKILLYCIFHHIIIGHQERLDVAALSHRQSNGWIIRGPCTSQTPLFFGFSTTNIPSVLWWCSYTTIVIFGPISSCTGGKMPLHHQLRSMTSSDLESLPPPLKYPVIFRLLFFELFRLRRASIFSCNNALFTFTLDSSTLSLRSLYWSGNIMLHMLAVLVSIRET